jgi:phage N-6-adenine-methyltransferase
MAMPKQRPGLSKQDYQTPVDLLDAVKARLHIENFSIDLAASQENAIEARYYSEEDDSLVQSWVTDGWAWLNPPYAKIEPWVAKAANEAAKGAHIAMLVPASIGADWWLHYVEGYAYQSFLNGRLCFIPDWRERGFTTKPLYPKDCVLLLYTPWGFTGHEIWNWRGK